VTIHLNQYNKIVFFTGAGMSAESGVPTYRGRGGIWHEYKWENYACQTAFIRNPAHVIDFHELRRIEALKCEPHVGHKIITALQTKYSNTSIVTQNIDGMHQRAGSQEVIELHGSLWRMRCDKEGKLFENLSQGKYANRKCSCGEFLRPDIIWFEDQLNESTVVNATHVISQCDLFISIGTSGVVWPAAGFQQLAKKGGAHCIEINPEKTELSYLFDDVHREPAGQVLSRLFDSLL
jgi:NAD-dependent deacetylase